MKAIVVVDKNWGIGKNNDLLFRLPADMKHFRETTSGKVVVMGSNTLLSFPGGKPYRTLLPYCSEVIATKADADGGAEVFFENLDALPQWSLASAGDALEDNGVLIRFCVYRNADVKKWIF